MSKNRARGRKRRGGRGGRVRGGSSSNLKRPLSARKASPTTKRTRRRSMIAGKLPLTNIPVHLIIVGPVTSLVRAFSKSLLRTRNGFKLPRGRQPRNMRTGTRKLVCFDKPYLFTVTCFHGAVNEFQAFAEEKELFMPKGDGPTLPKPATRIFGFIYDRDQENSLEGLDAWTELIGDLSPLPPKIFIGMTETPEGGSSSRQKSWRPSADKPLIVDAEICDLFEVLHVLECCLADPHSVTAVFDFVQTVCTACLRHVTTVSSQKQGAIAAAQRARQIASGGTPRKTSCVGLPSAKSWFEFVKEKIWLHSILDKLKMVQQYWENFIIEGVMVADLNDMDDQGFEDLIPDRIPRRRFKLHLKRILKMELPAENEISHVQAGSAPPGVVGDGGGGGGAGGGMEIPKLNLGALNQPGETRGRADSGGGASVLGLGNMELLPCGAYGDERNLALTPRESPIGSARDGPMTPRVANEMDRRKVHLREYIKCGAHGRVRKGFFEEDGVQVPVAIKELPYTGDQVEQTEIIREIGIMRALVHENVVKFFGCWCSRSKRKAYIVMELCPTALDDYLHTFTTDLQRVDCLIQICRGMVFIHNSSFVHKDLKPSNILVTSDGVMKITDFGTTSRDITVDTRAAQGTVEYMSKESYLTQVKKQDSRLVDVYAFGIIAWQVLTSGKYGLPYSELGNINQFAKLRAIHEEGIRPNIRYLEDRPRLLKLVERCWNDDILIRPEFEFVLRELQMINEELLAVEDE